jgi:glycine betaine/proline transport system substrate-binding protein
MKKLLASTVFAAGMIAIAGSAQAAECGKVTVANMNWASAEVLANIDAIVLAEGYGCDVELVAGDTQPTLTSMVEKGEPDVAPEAWINAMRSVLDTAVGEGRLFMASESLNEGGVEGWWVPKYIVDANPDIKTIADALKRPDLFKDPENDGKGGVHNCPEGWNCRVSTSNLFKAYGAEAAGFNLVETGSAAGLDGSIAKAFERNEGWLGYYWAPTAILGKYEMVRLDHGVPHDKAAWDACTSIPDCADPKPNAWAKSEVFTVVTKRFKEAGGPAYDYLAARNWDNQTVGKLLAWMGDNQATGADGAKHFLKENADIWMKWVSPEAAEKIKAAVM